METLATVAKMPVREAAEVSETVGAPAPMPSVGSASRLPPRMEAASVEGAVAEEAARSSMAPVEAMSR
jgi:hypothetical protein